MSFYEFGFFFFLIWSHWFNCTILVYLYNVGLQVINQNCTIKIGRWSNSKKIKIRELNLQMMITKEQKYD